MRVFQMVPIFFLSLPLCFSCTSKVTPTALPANVPSVTKILGDNIVMEIKPEVELLAAVQLCTTWASPGQPGNSNGRNTLYMKELKDFIAPYRLSEAVRISQYLLFQGFSYDAPPNLVLSTRKGLSFDPPAEGYGDYLIGRSKGTKTLDNFAAALRNLATESRFDLFFEAHRDYYQRLIDGKSADLKAEQTIHWLTNWFGATQENYFHYVLSPAMMPAGGYGATILRQEEGTSISHVYEIVRDAEKTDPKYLNYLALHEFGHSFVNPAIGDQVEKLSTSTRKNLERIFKPVRPRMTKMAYPELTTFLNELVLRAATIRGRFVLGELDDQGVTRALQAEADKGFYCITAVYPLLVEYESNRDTWPAFIEYGPVLLERLAEQADRLIMDRLIVNVTE